MEYGGSIASVKTRFTPAKAKALTMADMAVYLDQIRDVYGKYSDTANHITEMQGYGALTGKEVLEMVDKMKGAIGTYVYVSEILTIEINRRFKADTGVSHSSIDFDGMLQGFSKKYPVLMESKDVWAEKFHTAKSEREQKQMLDDMAKEKSKKKSKPSADKDVIPLV